jgi:hypothetical protein
VVDGFDAVVVEPLDQITKERVHGVVPPAKNCCRRAYVSWFQRLADASRSRRRTASSCSDCGTTSRVLVRLIALAHPTFAARSRGVRCRPRSPEGAQSGQFPEHVLGLFD